MGEVCGSVRRAIVHEKFIDCCEAYIKPIINSIDGGIIKTALSAIPFN